MLQYRTRNKNQLQVTIATFAFLLLTTLTGQQCLAQATQPEDANAGKPTQQVTPGVSSRTASPEKPQGITADPKTSLPSQNVCRPLTLSELEVEAKAWQDLLKQNVERINALHIKSPRGRRNFRLPRPEQTHPTAKRQPLPVMTGQLTRPAQKIRRSHQMNRKRNKPAEHSTEPNPIKSQRMEHRALRLSVHSKPGGTHSPNN